MRTYAALRERPYTSGDPALRSYQQVERSLVVLLVCVAVGSSALARSRVASWTNVHLAFPSTGTLMFPPASRRLLGRRQHPAVSDAKDVLSSHPEGRRVIAVAR
jgi:hypothetical protein